MYDNIARHWHFGVIKYKQKQHKEKEMKYFEVNGKPFIAIAGEAHNSSASNAKFMEGVWDKAEQIGLNTVLMPLYWELIEPEEGRFEFKLVDDIIMQARERNMKIGFLWFGAWKNAQMYYAPEWVKTDLKRFWRAEMKKGQPKTRLENFHGMEYYSLSYLCEATKQADCKAFVKTMEHIREFDEKEQTVICMQVENETGVQGFARENSDYADEAFAANAPQDLVDFMRSHTGEMAADVKAAVESGKESGTWREVFGDVAEEVFSAYYISSYVNYLATEGKKAYDIPMTVNCWLDKGEDPGMYPSGGPVARMLEVWKHCAPAIDIFAPDIYVNNFCEVCDDFRKLNNPLFIPETATHSHAGPRLVYAIGHHHAVCFAPFGFEDMGEPISGASLYLFGGDPTDPLLSQSQDPEEYRWYAKTLNSMMDKLTAAYGTNRLQAAINEPNKGETKDMLFFGKYGFKVVFSIPQMPQMKIRTDGVFLALQESEDTFYIIVNGCLSFASFSTEGKLIDELAMDEGVFENGEFVSTRRLNGDETAMRMIDKPRLLRIKLFAY